MNISFSKLWILVVQKVGRIVNDPHFFNKSHCFHGQFDVGSTPVALNISLREVALPLYADLSIKDVDRFCDIIISCKK